MMAGGIKKGCEYIKEVHKHQIYSEGYAELIKIVKDAESKLDIMAKDCKRFSEICNL